MSREESNRSDKTGLRSEREERLRRVDERIAGMSGDNSEHEAEGE